MVVNFDGTFKNGINAFLFHRRLLVLRDSEKCKNSTLDIVGNKAKGRISKWLFQENKYAKFSEKRLILTP